MFFSFKCVSVEGVSVEGVSVEGGYAKDGDYLKIKETELKDVCKPLVCNDSKYFWLTGGDCLFIYSLEILSE